MSGPESPAAEPETGSAATETGPSASEEASSASGRPLGVRDVFSLWWPLAASWLMMAFEVPAVSAVVARLADPTVHLAAYGGVVFPLALLVEAPIIMLLSASTALSRDWESYVRLRRFTFWASTALTVIHVLIAATPLYGFVVGSLMNAPMEVREPARWGLLIMTPWTASIAFRRFQQGVLIRSGRSKLVGVGTGVRLCSNLLILGIGYAIGSLPGIVVGASAVAVGVMAEAFFIAIVVRPDLIRLQKVVSPDPPLAFRAFLSFYVPLAMTSFITLFTHPILSSGMARMPNPLESLAAWPVVTGLLFAFRSSGFAFNEVVVASLDRPGASAALVRFATLLALWTTSLLALLAATPLGWFWFNGVSGLPRDLAELGVNGLWIALLLPSLSVFQSWFQGRLVHGHRTRGISEAVLFTFLTIITVLALGAAYGKITGLYVSLAAMTLGGLLQLSWLAWRSRSISA